MIEPHYLQLAEVTPGAQTWLALINSDLAQINASQPYIRKGVAGEALAVNDAVAMGADGSIYKADSNGANYRFNMLGVARNAASVGQDVYYVRSGEVPFPHAWTPGAPVYLSDTAGALSSSPATTARIVALALPGNKILLEPARAWAAA